MSTERERLLSLIEFAQQSARLRGKPTANVSEHGLIAIYEHEIQGLPGIQLAIEGRDGAEEIWLSVERLHETKPPEARSALLQPWLQLTQGPNEEPRLRDAVDGASLIAAGTHSPASTVRRDDKNPVEPNATRFLASFPEAEQVRAEFSAYVETKWRPWAEVEKLRRKTIRLYSQLFTLKQRLEGSIIEAQLELVWGVGVGIWKCDRTVVNYPLIGQLVEMSLDPATATIEIRPRDIDAQLEIDWYASVDNPGVAALEKAAKELFGGATATFSPFDRGTFEPLLRTAATSLDSNGMYWPNEVPAEDRTLPKVDDRLRVTDTWVLFARPRTNSLFLQDLEKLKKQAEEAEDYPPAVAAVVQEPATTNPVVGCRSTVVCRRHTTRR